MVAVSSNFYKMRVLIQLEPWVQGDAEELQKISTSLASQGFDLSRPQRLINLNMLEGTYSGDSLNDPRVRGVVSISPEGRQSVQK
jgi:hypothetical protein